MALPLLLGVVDFVMRPFSRVRVEDGAARVALLVAVLQLVLVVSPDRFFRECRQLIRQLGLQERVKVFHRISDVEKPGKHLVRGLTAQFS